MLWHRDLGDLGSLLLQPVHRGADRIVHPPARSPGRPNSGQLSSVWPKPSVNTPIRTPSQPVPMAGV